jgi:uncharacterized membrane protein YphA (DoxX/SURF4 family)
MNDQRLDLPYWALRLGLGIVPIVAGIDKFTNLLVQWQVYLSPLAVRLLPISPGAFMRAAGIVEIVVGLAILAGFTRSGGYVAAVWLAGIVLNLVVSGAHLDVAARDAVMVIAAFTLGRLTEVREHATADEGQSAGGHGHAAHAHA